MELILAYAAGLLTLINPCVLPVLPIVLASSLDQSNRGPLALAAGLTVSFVVFGVTVTAFGSAIGLTQEGLSQIGAVLMIVFGTILIIPIFARKFEMATAGISAGADQRMFNLDLGGFKGQFLGGILLGAVWSPCIGPTLGAAISLASQGQNLIWVTVIMLFFAFGVSTIILALGFGARSALRSRTQSLASLAHRTKPIMGAIFILVGTAILFKIHHLIEAWAVRVLPYWLQDLSVAI